ncbi:hypothetical protein HHI36_005834, partial [Cryptolaemus montrouzieri]
TDRICSRGMDQDQGGAICNIRGPYLHVPCPTAGSSKREVRGRGRPEARYIRMLGMEHRYITFP